MTHPEAHELSVHAKLRFRPVDHDAEHDGATVHRTRARVGRAVASAIRVVPFWGSTWSSFKTSTLIPGGGVTTEEVQEIQRRPDVMEEGSAKNAL